MGRPQSSITERLDWARRQRVPVAVGTVGRSSLDFGYVAGLADGWVIVHRLLEHVYLDDVVLLRLDQVTEVDPHPHQAYVMRAVDGLGVSRARFDPGRAASIDDLLRIVAARGEAVSVSYADDDGHRWDECGVIRTVDRSRFVFHHLEPDGVWAPEPGLRRLDHVVAVGTGGLYLTALDRFKDRDPAQ